MRLIDADALLQELNRKGIPYNCAVNWEITHAPTVQTEPRRTGRWVTTSWDNAYFTCSECGRVLPDDADPEVLQSLHG